MTAIAGTFADFKIIKTRDTAQLVIEIPLTDADAALAALGGVPRPGAERWVGLARIPDQGPAALPAPSGTGPLPASDAAPSSGRQPAGAAPVQKPKQRWQDMPVAQRAALICSDPRAWPVLTGITRWEIDNENRAAEAMRLHCGVKTRAAIADQPRAYERFTKIETAYFVATGRIASP